MTALVMMGLKMGVVMVGFVSAGKVLEWYHKDDTATTRGGGARNGKRTKRDDEFFF